MKLPTNYGFVHDRHMTLSRVPIVLHTVRGVMYNVHCQMGQLLYLVWASTSKFVLVERIGSLPVEHTMSPPIPAQYRGTYSTIER